MENEKEVLDTEMKEIDRKGEIIVSIILAGGMIPFIVMFSKDVTTANNGIYLWLSASLFIAFITKIFSNILNKPKIDR